MVDADGNIYRFLVVGSLAPLNAIFISHLEMPTEVLSVQLDNMIRRQFDLQIGVPLGTTRYQLSS